MTPNLQQAIQAAQQARNLQGTLDHMELSVDQMLDGPDKQELAEHLTGMTAVVTRMVATAEAMKQAARAPNA